MASLPPKQFGYTNASRAPPSLQSRSTPAKKPTLHRNTPRRHLSHSSITTTSTNDPAHLETPLHTTTTNHDITTDNAKMPANPSKASANLRPTPAVTRPRRARSSTTNRINTKQLRNDRLGTLVKSLCDRYYDAGCSWEDFVNEFRGPSYLSPELEQVDHPAMPLLRQWRDKGVPAQTSAEP